MNTLKKLLMVAVLGIVQAYALTASAALGYMRLSLIETEVQIKTPEAGEWGYAAINTPLDVGDEIWVPEGGRAELQLNTGTYIRLDGNTAIQILSMDQESSQFFLAQGNAYIYYEAPRGSVIQVDTPDASTRAFDRAIFSLSISSYYTDVTAYKGYVVTENQVGETRVNAGNMVSLGPDTNGEIYSIGNLDDWERWNQARDESLYNVRESQSVRYLPSELRTYYSDFDSYGSWVNVSEYGNVWTPRIHGGRSWSPYREGRWIWRGGDYIWVAYEPWGWAPYHYGRWAYAVNVGWCWVPPLPGSVHWGPGYVGWIRTDDYVAWVPLAPGEIYYGRGHYGRDSVNIVNVNINEIHFTNIYQNINVNNGPIVVAQRSFHEGSQTIVNLDKNIHNKVFTRNNMIPGAPDIKPSKKRLFAVEKEIPKDKLPPQRVRVQPVTETTKIRGLTREERKSVFNPGAEPASLPTKKADKERVKGKEQPKLEKIQTDLQKKGKGPEDRRDIGREGKPVQQEQLDRPLPAGPEGARDGKREKVQPLPDQQRRPMGPPEEGRRTKETQPQPVQKEQLDRPLPAGPEGARDGKREKVQPLPDQQRRPMGPPEEGRRTKETQPKPIQKEQLDRPLPAGPEGVRDGKREKVQPPPPVQQKELERPRPPAVPEGAREGKREKVQPPPPVQQKELERPQPAKPERVKQQPVQPKQVERPQPARPEGAREGKGEKAQQPQQVQPAKKQAKPEAPLCGPGQKDQGDPEKCPQNFPDINKLRKDNQRKK